jgi:uncharacterized protein (TIGR02246 family)
MLSHQRIALLVLVGVTLSAALQREPGSLTDADRKGIQTVTDNFVRAVLAGDSVSAASAYTEDGMVLPPNGTVVQGRTAIRHHLAGFPKVTAFNPKLVEIDGQGPLAYVRGTYELTVMLPGEKSPVKDTGKFIEIRRKEPNGSWLILRDFWNSDLAPGR